MDQKLKETFLNTFERYLDSLTDEQVKTLFAETIKNFDEVEEKELYKIYKINSFDCQEMVGLNRVWLSDLKK